MARTIVSSLILAGVIGLVTLVVSMQSQQAKDREDVRVQSATIIAQIANIQYNTSDVPAMRANQVRMDAVQVEILRRLNADDEAFMRLGVYPAKAKQ